MEGEDGASGQQQGGAGGGSDHPMKQMHEQQSYGSFEEKEQQHVEGNPFVAERKTVNKNS